MAGSTDEGTLQEAAQIAEGWAKNYKVSAKLISRKKLRNTQQFISKYESGERRLDAIEFTDIFYAVGLDREDLLLDVAPHLLTLAKRSLKP